MNKEQRQELIWKDIEHQIYDEIHTKTFEVRFFGLKVFNRSYSLISTHELLKENRKIGFLSDDKKR